MVFDAAYDLANPDPRTRAKAYIERGISLAEAGDHDAAMIHLEEAERIATEADAVDLIVSSRINQGYAYTVQGDRASSIRLYVEAADRARDAGDAMRLAIALGNLDVEFKLEDRHPEAIAALTEYIDLLAEDDTQGRVEAFMSRAVSRIETGEFDEAFADLEDADRIATEADDTSLMCLVRMNQGYAYSRNEDLPAATVLYGTAVDLARTIEAPEYLEGALMNLAQVNRGNANQQAADGQFAELERITRSTGNTALLADVLYWRGVVLQDMGRRQPALEKWREEELIRRELGQERYLADCLAAQAEALRRRGERDAADPLYAEAANIYERFGVRPALISTLYEHGLSLWANAKPEEALERADKALALIGDESEHDIHVRLLALRATALADLGESSAAEEALDAAESLCEQAASHSLMVWTITRRAYVFARQGRSPEEVGSPLRRAFDDAAMYDEVDTFKAALNETTSHIVARFGEKYRRPIEALREELLTGWHTPAPQEL